MNAQADTPACAFTKRRIVVASAAYLGDVAPYIPVAERLADAGHDVTFLAPEGFRSVLEGRRFAYAAYPLDCSSAGMHADPRHERLMRHPYANVTRLGRYWMGKAFADDPARATECLEQVLTGADVLVTHPTFGAVAIPVAHGYGVPVAVGHLFPMMVPTASWSPPLGSRSPNLGRTANRLAWKALFAGSGPVFHDGDVNRLRARYGQPPLRGNAGRAWQEADRTVLLVSRHYYGDAAADWPVTTWGGFSVWDGGGAVPAEVTEFVDADPDDPPVLVTLGTSAASGAGDAVRPHRRRYRRSGAAVVVVGR